MKFLSTDTNGKLHFTVYYVRKNIDVGKCKLQEEEVDEINYFKIEQLQNLDTEGFEWLENLNKVMGEL